MGESESTSHSAKHPHMIGHWSSWPCLHHATDLVLSVESRQGASALAPIRVLRPTSRVVGASSIPGGSSACPGPWRALAKKLFLYAQFVTFHLGVVASIFLAFHPFLGSGYCWKRRGRHTPPRRHRGCVRWSV